MTVLVNIHANIHTHIYTHIYAWIHMHVHAYTFIRSYETTHLNVHTHSYTCEYITHIHSCTYELRHKCTHVNMFLCNNNILIINIKTLFKKTKKLKNEKGRIIKIEIKKWKKILQGRERRKKSSNTEMEILFSIASKITYKNWR